MRNTLEKLQKVFKTELSKVHDVKSAEELKLKYLGKKGILPELMMQLREAASEERPVLGKLVNEFKIEVEDLVQKALNALQEIALHQKLQEEKIDIFLPGRKNALGRKHPIYQMMDHVIETLKEMGFSVQYGPDVDSDYYNYEGLNFPKDHPARDMQDTFYINEEFLLRSHTSNTQLRVMEMHKPPLRIIMPGTVFRNENISARSHVFFHQVEGIYIDKGVTFADLLTTMREFWSRLFGKEVNTRFRPSFFPFVEPGLEVDIACVSCEGKGCRLCKNSGWLEVAGAGLIHPEVLKNGGVDPEVYSGYAWGLGIERLAMLLYGVKDIRQFTENDLRFLNQF